MENIKLYELLPQIQASLLFQTSYRRVRTFKWPCDAWVYHEIIWETFPDVIIEIGNKFGGSALYLADMLGIVGKGRVIGVDKNHRLLARAAVEHKRITFVTGDALEVFETVRDMIEPEESVMIIEDSSHEEQFTYKLLNLYSPLVTSGQYFIVEDTIINNGLVRNHPGPMPAVEKFLRGNSDFVADKEREHFIITWHPGGYLKRK